MRVRAKLTLSYAGFLLVTGALLLAVVWVFLLRYVPPDAAMTSGGFMPGRNDLIRAFFPKAAWALFFLLVFGLAGGWLLAGRMLAPLARITRATRKVAAGSLEHRIELTGNHDEFRELADSFDSMLARLEAQLAEQQRFAANVSHELRTPLAITRTLLEVARSDPGHDADALLRRLETVNSRAVELTEALLLLSRADSLAFSRESVDLSLLAEEAVETLLPLAEQRGLSLQADGTEARVTGSPVLLLQLVVNLVHNAIVHNRPADGWVRLLSGSDGGQVFLTVENSGDMLTEAAVATFTASFQRHTVRVRSDQAGVGLGLTIVESIAKAHGGSLGLAPRPDGGLAVTLTLPRALHT